MAGPYSPVVIFAFNRADHLERTMRALEQCPEASQTEVFVRVDGPRQERDRMAQAAIRKLLSQPFRFAFLHVEWSLTNRGLAESLIGGISELIQKQDELIILEDDIVVSEVFLRFMNFYLEKYRNEERVISIHGYMYPVIGLPEAFFLRGTDCWGWATWGRGWKLFERDGQKLLSELKKRHLTYAFDYDGTYPYTQMLKDQIDGKVNSWAIRWGAAAFLADRLTLYPGQSLVSNIGMDGSGEHCEATTQNDTILAHHFNKLNPALKEDESAREILKKHFRKLHPTYIQRVWRKLGKVLGFV